MLGVSLAVAKAGAAANQIPLYQHFANLAQNSKLVLPVPSLNVINGGEHAGTDAGYSGTRNQIPQYAMQDRWP